MEWKATWNERSCCMTLAEKHVDPRVKLTRQLLQQAFMELFREKGWPRSAFRTLPSPPVLPLPPISSLSRACFGCSSLIIRLLISDLKIGELDD